MKWLVKPFKVLFYYRNIIKQTSYNDIKARYAGSLLGLAWAALYPMLFLGCYAIIYIYIFNVRFQMFNTNEYVILIFVGLIPFIAFQDAVSFGVGCVVENASLMKNTLFPIELIPVKTIFSTQTTQISGFILLLIALGFLGKLTIWTPFFIVMWILQTMFNIGLAWILSSLNVIFRDLKNIVAIIIILLMMISPIAYPVEMVPTNLQPLLKANPLYYIISSYQDVLMFGRFPKLETFIPFLIISLSTFILGYWFFMKMKRVFVDNV